MELGELYHYLFETIPGNGVLVGIAIVISVIVSIIFEIRTRKRYKNHEKTSVDEWSIFEDIEEGELEEEEKLAKKASGASSGAK